ncbi:hypothetical protein B0T17DRAFT_648634 [Bombardia bombarda]|uniref:Protein kinase domain-containing protein n=1 Tax=Bombardia bombarda TaxID=252184 RepID=A0AA39TTZ9_9PEZI|nr:hypothetical protein B0T17DRAFT_648634 [Bombardia bombarda]
MPLADTLRDPYITGFDSAREVGAESPGYRPTGAGPVDYCYHPDVVKSGSTKKTDLYSFGVLLLELAYWRPLRGKVEKARATGSLQEIGALFVKAAKEQLPAMAGAIYAGVVEWCLDGVFSLGDEYEDGSGVWEGELACAMGVEVVGRLEECRA